VSFDIPNRTVDYAKQSMRHVKGTLPPSLSGIPGDIAWIKYFLKATVNRPAFYKTNLRQYDPFVFLPIESPRPPPTNAEAFARRKHEFIPAQPQSATKKPGLFMSFRKPEPAAVGPPVPVRFTVEARLPSPPILVPNEPLPLRILLTKLDPFHDVVVIRSLQIMLLATTHISAHELVKDEFTELCLLSVADLRMQLGDANSPPNVPLEVDASMWRGRYLPETLSPTFSTCNISRAYQLKIEIGLSRPDEHHIDASSAFLFLFFLLLTANPLTISRSSPSSSQSKSTPASNPPQNLSPQRRPEYPLNQSYHRAPLGPTKKHKRNRTVVA